MELLKKLFVEEEGQGMTEYALIVGLVVLGIWIAVGTGGISTAITDLFTRVATQLGSCVSGSCP
jgi:pilus assembly protein Flp/PilA